MNDWMVIAQVHVVDRSLQPDVAAREGVERHGNIFRRPQIARFAEGGHTVVGDVVDVWIRG
jgi:hypothetical protein